MILLLKGMYHPLWLVPDPDTVGMRQIPPCYRNPRHTRRTILEAHFLAEDLTLHATS